MKYLYKVEQGEVIAKLFALEDKPESWHDSPKAAKSVGKKDDNSANTDKRRSRPSRGKK